MKTVFFSVFALIFTAIPSFSTDYYVTKAGGGTTCSFVAPCLTIAIGIGKLAGGDTLLIGPGTYAEQVNNTVPAGSSINAQTTIRAVNEPVMGSKGQITSDVIIKPTGVTDVIKNTHNYVKFHGLDVDATSADGAPFQFYNGGTPFNGVTVEYSRAHGGNNNVSSMSGIMGDISNSYIQYNEVDHNGDNVGGNQDHGIYTPGPTNTIRYNYVHDNEAYCLVIYPSANANVIYGNRCESNDTRGIIISGDSNKFYNNIQDSDYWGLEVAGSSNIIYSNTFYNNGHGSAGTGKECVVFTAGSGNLARNNICYANETNSINQSGGTATLLTNYTLNPVFVNASLADFTLHSDSGAINYGTTLGSPYTADIVGVTRPQGSAYDAGAYEFVSGSVSTGPEASYSFNEGGGAIAVDQSGGANTLSLAGTYTWTTGKNGGGLQFDGATAYGQAPTIQNLSQWTVELWVKSAAIPNTAGYSMPLHRNKNFQVNWNHVNAACEAAAGVRVAGTFYCASFGTLSANTFYHLAATYDGTSLRAYRDGILINTATASPIGPADSEVDPVTVGASSALDQFFAGVVDDVRIYDRVLTAAEILIDMGSPTGSVPPRTGIFESSVIK